MSLGFAISWSGNVWRHVYVTRQNFTTTKILYFPCVFLHVFFINHINITKYEDLQNISRPCSLVMEIWKVVAHPCARHSSLILEAGSKPCIGSFKNIGFKLCVKFGLQMLARWCLTEGAKLGPFQVWSSQKTMKNS